MKKSNILKMLAVAALLGFNMAGARAQVVINDPALQPQQTESDAELQK